MTLPTSLPSVSALPNAGSPSQLTVLFAPQFLQINPYQKQLAQALENLGVEVRGFDPNQSFLSVLQQSQLKVLHLHWLHPFYQSTSLKKSLRKLVQFMVGLLVLRLRGVKIVWTAHNLKNHEAVYPRLDRLCTTVVARWADRIIAHCDAAKAEIAATFNIREHRKIAVMPHGHYAGYYDNTISQTLARQQLGLDPSKRVFLFLGMIRPYKGILELIEIVQQLEREDVQLVLAGKPLNDGMVAQIREKIIDQDSIRFLPGFVPEDQVQVYMNACDAVVFPYRDVLTSGAVILAMSFNKACIAPRMGCIAEVLENAGACLYNPEIEDGLLQAITAAATLSREELAIMGQFNRQQVERWTWKLVAEMTLQVYQDGFV